MSKSYRSGTQLLLALLILIGSGFGRLFAQIPFETTPSWRSSDSDHFSTGAAWGDIDNDGFLELAVSNGNDMSAEPNVIYDNIDGVLQTTYSWTSANEDYSGKCALGDINRDGWLDFVVVNYGPVGPWRLDNLYMNVNGVIHPVPVWNHSPADSDNTFGLDLGDVDGDGDLDLAAANGEAYTVQRQPHKVYINDGTIFEEEASWLSDERMMSYDAMWGDVDRDGDLDLAVANSSDPLQVYYNLGSALQTSAAWSSIDVDDHNTLAWGDMNGDGWLDLAVSTNIQLGGSGRFKVYLNDGNGKLARTASWQSNAPVYGSGIAWADCDSDGDLDLAAGSWWGRSSIYENVDGMLMTTPSWQCTPSYSSVVETMAWGDVEGDGLRRVIGESQPVDGIRKLFYLYHYPANSLDSVYVDGARLDPGFYCESLRSGWVSLSTPPQQSVAFFYSFSRDLDLAVSNWDRENYVFTNLIAIDEDVSILLFPESTTLAPGGELRYRASVMNNTPNSIQVTVMGRVRLPNGNPFNGNPVYGPENFDLIPYETADLLISHPIPFRAPSGEYTYTFLAGIPPSTLLDLEEFRFTIEE